MTAKTKHQLYNVWRSMRDRCYNPNSKPFADYGGRGIKICDRWADFYAFVQDMGPRPEGYSIDRIDNDGDYEPGNCRWADRRTQQRNQRRAVYVEIEGTKYRAIELAEAIGAKTDTIVKRAANGLSLSDVLSKKRHVFTDGLALGGKASGAKKLARTHCPKGHEFTPENTYWRKDNSRQCRQCHNAKMKRLNDAKKLRLSVS